MLSTSAILPFLLASIGLTVMPGPDNIFVLTESLTKGAKTGIIISLGLLTGVFIHTFLAASGAALFLKTSPFAFTTLKILGSAYLLYLAYLEYKSDPNTALLNQETDQTPFHRLFIKGFFMNVLNPKVSLFFLAFLPVFVEDQSKSFGQMVQLGIIFIMQGLVIFFAISLFADRLSQTIKSPKFWWYAHYIKIIILVGLAASLFFF